MLFSQHSFAVLLLIPALLSNVLSFRQISLKSSRSLLKPLLPRVLNQSPPRMVKNGGISYNYHKDDPVNVRPTLADNTRTITHICKSGTLSTISDEGHPLGSSVDYVLNQRGHPIFFFSKSSTTLSKNPRASFFCKIPMEYEQTSSLSSKSASIQGQLVPVSNSEVKSLKIAFSLTHPYSTDHIGRKSDIYFARLQPEQVFYSTGDFGATQIPIDTQAYESALPDILAQEIPTLLPRLNIAKQYELRLLCKHILNIHEDVDTVTLQAIDKLGIDVRTIKGHVKDEYRVAFRDPINSAEDAKSELIKLFQECYMRENGKTGFVPQHLPIVVKYC